MIEYKSEIINITEKKSGCIVLYSVFTNGRINIKNSPDFRTKSDAVEWCKIIIDVQLHNNHGKF